MPSPFPGMDPYIEQQEWSDFHSRFNVAIADQLSAKIEPRYYTRVERRVYMEAPKPEELPESDKRVVGKIPDVAVVVATEAVQSGGGTAIASVPVAEDVEPVECLLPEPIEHRESYLVIKDRDHGEVVTIIETLSPTNKRRGSVGNDEYLSKRDLVLDSSTHLVELDLLRGGDRLPMLSLPPGDYYALVSRSPRRPRVSVFGWRLRQRLPEIPIPLKPEDPEPKLDLQAALNTVYDGARYQLSLNYQRSLEPDLTQEQQQWATDLILKTT